DATGTFTVESDCGQSGASWSLLGVSVRKALRVISPPSVISHYGRSRRKGARAVRLHFRSRACPALLFRARACAERTPRAHLARTSRSPPQARSKLAMSRGRPHPASPRARRAPRMSRRTVRWYARIVQTEAMVLRRHGGPEVIERETIELP